MAPDIHDKQYDHLRNSLALNFVQHGNVTLYTQNNNESGLDRTHTTEYFAAHQIWVYAAPILLVVGTIGSILSLLVLCRKPLRGQTTMFYLAVLAVADLMVLYAGLLRLYLENAHDFYIRLISGTACKLHNFFVYLSLDFSVWILVAVSIDRCLFVSWPHVAKKWCTLRNARVVVFIIALVSAMINAHFIWTYDVEYEQSGEIFGTGGWRCYVDTSSSVNISFIVNVWPWVDFCVYCLFPFVLMATCNIIIIKQLARSERKMASHSSFRRDDNEAVSRWQKIKTEAKSVKKIRLKSNDTVFGEKIKVQSQLPRSETETTLNCNRTTDVVGEPQTASALQLKVQNSLSPRPPVIFRFNNEESVSGILVVQPETLNSSGFTPKSGCGLTCLHNKHAHFRDTKIFCECRNDTLANSMQCELKETSVNPLTLVEDIPSSCNETFTSGSVVKLMENQPNSGNLTNLQSLAQSQKSDTSDNKAANYSQLSDTDQARGLHTSSTVASLEMSKPIPERKISDTPSATSPSNISTRFNFDSDDQEALIVSKKELFAAKFRKGGRMRKMSRKVYPQPESAQNLPSVSTAFADSVAPTDKFKINGIRKQSLRSNADDNATPAITTISNNVQNNQTIANVNTQHADSPGKPTDSRGHNHPQPQTRKSETLSMTTLSVSKRSSISSNRWRSISVNSEGQASSRRNTSSVSKTLLAITVTFWIFNAPIVIYIIGYTYWSKGIGTHGEAKLLLAWAVVNVLQYMNNAMHLFLYCLTGPKFRQELVKMFESAVSSVKGWVGG